MGNILHDSELQQALEKSWQEKNGGWSTVKEVARFTDEKVTLKAMRELVEKDMAVEKETKKKFKPKKGAVGGPDIGSMLGRGVGAAITGGAGGQRGGGALPRLPVGGQTGVL